MKRKGDRGKTTCAWHPGGSCGDGALGADSIAHTQKKKPQPKLVGVFIFLVAWGGIEPPTRGFSIRCSTN
ncbi:hypothetical protein FUT89_22190 [Ralstonia pseudosolanacearum]|nr:hypothetical protein FUT89_22190 [Ralstonia pseudosolanacearum]